MKACSNCEAWDEARDQLHPHTGAAIRLGRCRRRAPQLHSATDHRAAWPVTGPHEGCFDHLPNEGTR